MPDLPDIQARVEKLIELERFDEARRMLGDAFALGPNDPDNHFLSARIAYQIDDYAAAQQGLTEALTARPDDYFSRSLLFKVQLETQQYLQAEQTILELLRENPDDGHLYALFARLMLKTLNLEKAGALIREALRLSPEDDLAQVLNILINIIEGRREGADMQLEQLVRDNPQALHVTWSIATVLQSKHRYTEALNVVRGILRTSPNDQETVDALIELRTYTHWTTIPLRPLLRYGFFGLVVFWMFSAGGLLLLARFAPQPVHISATILFLAFVAYSWVYPPLLRRSLRTRGF